VHLYWRAARARNLEPWICPKFVANELKIAFIVVSTHDAFTPCKAIRKWRAVRIAVDEKTPALSFALASIVNFIVRIRREAL
jgi:hypothetical protein